MAGVFADVNLCCSTFGACVAVINMISENVLLVVFACM